jgi:hypothetical protein
MHQLECDFAISSSSDAHGTSASPIYAALATHACCKLHPAISSNSINLHVLSWGLIKGVNRQQMGKYVPVPSCVWLSHMAAAQYLI